MRQTWVRRVEREYDAYGNPVRITERGFGTAPDRIRELAYAPRDEVGAYLVDRPFTVRRVAPGSRSWRRRSLPTTSRQSAPRPCAAT